MYSPASEMRQDTPVQCHAYCPTPNLHRPRSCSSTVIRVARQNAASVGGVSHVQPWKRTDVDTPLKRRTPCVLDVCYTSQDASAAMIWQMPSDSPRTMHSQCPQDEYIHHRHECALAGKAQLVNSPQTIVGTWVTDFAESIQSTMRITSLKYTLSKVSYPYAHDDFNITYNCIRMVAVHMHEDFPLRPATTDNPMVIPSNEEFAADALASTKSERVTATWTRTGDADMSGWCVRNARVCASLRCVVPASPPVCGNKTDRRTCNVQVSAPVPHTVRLLVPGIVSNQSPADTNSTVKQCCSRREQTHMGEGLSSETSMPKVKWPSLQRPFPKWTCTTNHCGGLVTVTTMDCAQYPTCTTSLDFCIVYC